MTSIEFAAAQRQFAGRALAEQRYADAAVLLEKVLMNAPDDADNWFNLGIARRMQLDPHAALAAYDRALAANISDPHMVYLNKAVIQSDLLHDVANARASLAAALAAEPDFILALLNLGQLEEDAGNIAAARAAYRALLVRSPGHGRAHARLAAMDVFEGKPQKALDRLSAAIGVADTTTDLFEIEFAAAAALDAAGDHEAAMERAHRANGLQQRFAEQRYDPSAQVRQVDALINLFPPEPPAPASNDAMDPLFICGLFRSGSTLLETLISRRFGITMGGEIDYTPWYVLTNGKALTAEGRDAFVAAYGKGYRDYAQTVLGDARRFTDKRMDNYRYLGLIKRAFPAAKIIHTMRNPIDNFLSMYFLPFADTLTYANDFDDMLHHYRQYRRLMAHWQQCFGDDIITVRYDDLVSDSDAVLAGLGNGLGLQPATADPGEQIIRTASVWQVRQPVHQRSSGRWRNYADHIGELAAVLQAEYPDFSQ